jgi:methyltransferase (TIGR00027 family)
VRDDTPSVTARGVAVARSRLERPQSPTGDADAETRLARTLVEGLTDDSRADVGDFLGYVAARTRFFDDAVIHAIDDRIRQVVILGAGYDGRALRFRTPGVRFFEVDHPATQADKRRRLATVGASTENITFVAADFTEPGLAGALASAGHDRDARSLFICEGVLRYLPERWFRELLRAAAECAATSSALAASISTRPSDREGEGRGDPARERRLAELGEPVLTVPDRDTAMQWLTGAGWSLQSVDEVSDTTPASRPGRLLVRAVR